MRFGIGQPVRRVEDVALLSGQGRYTDDLDFPSMLRGYVLRSPLAHARLLAVDARAARAMPGVRLVLTGTDAAADGIGDLPCLAPVKNRDGSDRASTPRPVLARDRVRHVGQPVAFVVAETLGQAKDAAEAIEVAYDPLPAVLDAEAALAPGAPLLFDEVPGNLIVDWQNEHSRPDEVAAAFATAAHVTRLRLVNNRVVGNPMEPRNAIGSWDAESGTITLHTATQGPHFAHGGLANAVFKVPPEKLRIITPANVGGGFGLKATYYPEQAMVCWAARRLNAPVKWQADRAEGFLADNQGRDHVVQAELALDGDHRFLAVRVRTIANLGAYLSPLGPFVPTRSSDLIAGLYTTPLVDISVRCVVTNTVPVCAYRGAGRPEAAYVIERLVDAAARELGIGPAALRRRNLIPAASIPYRAATGLDFDSGDFPGIMDAALHAADWEGFPARRTASAAAGRLRGIGLATWTERCGGDPPEGIRIEFRDDAVVDVVVGNQEYGTGLHTTYKQIMSERLGIEAEQVNVVMGDTARTPPGITGGSRGASVTGSAVLLGCDEVIEKGRTLAAHLLEAGLADIEYADGAFSVAGTDRRITLWSLAQLARDAANLPQGMAPGLDTAHFRQPPGATFPNGCHVVEVEIDPETGVLSIPRYTAVDDFGRALNPMMLEGQVHGGIVQGLGQALWEQVSYDPESGQLLSGSFLDYTMPRADLLPSFQFTTRNQPAKSNPLGVKGAGEAGSIAAPPAVMNAIIDALGDRPGAKTLQMPATAAAIWRAIREA